MANATLRKYISVKAPTGQDDLAKAMRTTVFAQNRLGGAVTFLGMEMQQFKDAVQLHTEFSTEMLQRQKDLDKKEHDTKVELIEAQEDLLGRKKGRAKDKASEALQEKVDPKEKKKKGEKLAKKEKPSILKWLGGFAKGLNPILKLIVQALAPLLTMKLLDWLSDEKNRAAIKPVIEFAVSLFKFSRALAGFGIENVMSGIRNIFGESDKTGMERIFQGMFGVLQMVGGLGALWAASRVLMPWKLIGDVKFMLGLGKAVSAAEKTGPDIGRNRNRGKGNVVGRDGRTSRQRLRDIKARRKNKRVRPRFRGRGRGRGLFGMMTGMCPNPLDLLPDNTPKNVVDNVAKNVDKVDDAAGAVKTAKNIDKAVDAVDTANTANKVIKNTPPKTSWFQRARNLGSGLVDNTVKAGRFIGEGTVSNYNKAVTQVDRFANFVMDGALKLGDWAGKGIKSSWDATTATAAKWGNGIKDWTVKTLDDVNVKAKNFFMEKILTPLKPVIDPLMEKASKFGAGIMEYLKKIPGYEKVGKIFESKGITNVATAGFEKLGKRAGAVLPVIGGVVNLAFAYDRFANGDSVGGLLESISGILDIGGLATAGATSVMSMFLDGYLFARDFLPMLEEGENALISALGLGGFKSTVDGMLSKLPDLGTLVGKFMSMIGMGDKEEKAKGGLVPFSRGGKVKEGMQKKRDIPSPTYTTPTPFVKGFDIPTKGEGQFKRFASGGLYVFSTAPAGAPKLMGHGKGFGDTYPHHHPKPGGNVPRAGGIPRDYLISELRNPARPDSKGDRHPIRAGVSGTVDSVGEGWGAVRIKDASGPMFRSGHMTGIRVKMGQQVNPSTIIGIQDAVGMSNGYVHAHIEGRTAAIHNAWIKANSGSKSTGSDDINVPTGDDGTVNAGTGSGTSTAPGAGEREAEKPKKIDIMEAFTKLGGADLLKSYVADINADPDLGGGGGGGANEISVNHDKAKRNVVDVSTNLDAVSEKLNKTSEKLAQESVASKVRTKLVKGTKNSIMIMRQFIKGGGTMAPEIITPGSGITPLITN